MTATPLTRAPLKNCPAPLRWLILLCGSVALAALLLGVQLPAALLLGPMLASIIIESAGGALRLPKLLHAFAQAVIGCLVARAITPTIVATFCASWPIFLSSVLSAIAISCAIGWFFSKLKILPGTTAIWGLLPGAASVMMLMAEEFGADARLVAFMQYLRVVVVALSVSTIARFWLHTQPVAPHAPIVWFPEIHWLAFAITLALILAGMIVGGKSRLPAGILLLPMIIGGVLNASGLVHIELPQWLLVVAYACLGWGVGMRFTPDVIAHAARVFPQTILSIILMILACAGLAFILVAALHVDPLTAYLAISPGGMDSIAIIAATSQVDVPFVMSLQMVRLLLVLALGPTASKFVASRLGVSEPTIVGAKIGPEEHSFNQEILDQVRDDESDLG